MYVSTRASRNTRIGGGPLFWLFAAPFILIGYAMIGAFIVASVAVAFIITGIKALLAKDSSRSLSAGDPDDEALATLAVHGLRRGHR